MPPDLYAGLGTPAPQGDPYADLGSPVDPYEGLGTAEPPGAIGGIVNAARRAGRSSLAGLDVMGAMAAGAKRDDYLAEADRLESQAGQIDQLAPTWQPETRTTWATRAKSTAAKLRARAQAMDTSATDSLTSAAQQTKKAEAIPLSEDYQAYGEAKGWDAVKQFAKNPVEIPLTIAAEGFAGSVPALVAGAAGAAVAGLPGLAAGSGLGSYTTEYFSTILDTLRDKGIDAKDASALKTAIADADLMAEAKKRAVARGIPVAVFDAISGGLAGRTVAPAVKGGIKAMAKATAKEVGEQAALGMAGETAGQVSEQLATKGTVEDLNLKDIVAEGIGEIVPGFGQVATGAIARTGLNPLRKSANDKPATPPAPNPSPAATPGAPASATPSPAPATPAAPGTDLSQEIGASLPDAESRDVLAGRSTEAEARKLADAKVDFSATVQSVQDALLTSGATPAQLDALDFQLRVLEERKDKRRLRPDQVNTSLANTFLFQALPPAEVFPLVSRLAADTANIQQLRAGLAALRTGATPAAAPAANVSPTPAAGLTPEQRAAKLAVLQQAEQDAAAAKAQAEATREQARLQAEADKKAQTERVRAENARLATLERTGRDETGKIADLTRVPDTEMAGLDLEREGITEAQFAAEMDRRARAEERNAATAGNRGEELLDVLAQVKLPGESATLPEELRTLIREGMTAKQRMALVRAGVGELDRTAEALRGRGFIWAKTPADVIDHVQRALRGEMIYAEGTPDDIQFARRPAPADPTATNPLAARWFDNLSLVAPGVAREVELRFGDPEQLVADGSVRASDLTGEEEAAALRLPGQTILYLFDRALRKNTEASTRRNLLHEIGHAFFDTLDTATRRALRAQWEHERDTRTGPLFDATGKLRDDVALGVFDEENPFDDRPPDYALHEWFAERLAHANDTWAKRRTDVRAQGDGILRTVAAEFRAMLLKLRELLERAFGRNGYDDQLVSDFRQFLDQGDRWNQDGPDADAELAGSFAKTGVLYARRNVTGVDFAAQASDYVTRNGTPAEKAPAARADIEHLLDVVADDQLDLFAYGTRGPDSARSAPLPRSDVERSGAVSRNADEAAALKNPTDSRALRTAYGIGERDAYGTTGTTRISSIIPELIADPKRTWDIRGATINTARDLVALVNVLRTPYVETTKIVFLNQSGEVVHSEIMSIGAISAANLNAQMMARTLSRAPATVNGYDIIISHNHPSGNPSPSPADVKITRHIREVLRATPHRFRDHVVTNGDTYFSFAESGEVGFVETGAITTKKPTAAGPDAQNRAELGTLAPWEKVARGELRPINSPYAVNEIVAALRQVDPTALHIIYLNHKTNLTALERVPEFTLEQGEDTNAIIGQIFAGLGREGANQFIVAAPDVMPAHAAARLMRDLRGWANTADIVFLDFASKTLTPESTARSVGLMEGPAPQFARRTDANPEGREPEQLLRDYASLERTRDRYVSDGQTVPRHILTGLADLREALEESLPGWRNQAKAIAAEQTVTTAPSAEPEAGASALFPSDEGTVAPEETATKRSQLEASTLRRPTGVRDWLASLGRLFTNFRSAIPELPGGAKGRVFTAFRQGYRMMRAATEFTRKDAEEKVGHILAPLTGLGADAIAPETYRELQKLQQIRQEQIEAGKPIRPELTRRIAQLDAQLDAVPYHLFRKVALYRDLFFRSRLEAPNGEPLRLPFGLTAAEIESTLRDLHAKVKASPHAAQIEESLRRHYALVKEVRDGLLARGYVIPEELRNPLYFPHIVIDKASGSISRVKLDTAEDFRGYLVRLVGSERAIESDYLQAMYYHLATVEAHNARQDIVAKYWQPYDIKADLVKQAAEMNQERQARGLGPINWRQLVPEGHVIYTVDDRIPLRPEYLINRQVLAEKLGVQLGEGDLQKQLRDLGMSVTLTADDFQAALMAGEKTQWVVPKPVADALRAILDREARTAGLAERVLTTPQGLWKRWTLFAPQNVIRYTYGNMVADLEKLFSADPGVFRQLRPAMEEVRAFYDGQKPSADLRAAFERGVLDAVTVGEVTDLAREQLDQFAAFTTSRERFVGMLKRGLGWGVTVNRIREASFRYAKFKADLERQRAGAEPIYAGAYNRDVRAIREDTPEATHYARAAEISRKTFGDYADISVSGDGLRKYFIPFYSWMEVNFRYHANLFRNLGDMGAGAGAAQIARGTAAAASRILVARSATGVLLRLAVPYAAVALWNNSGDREDLEKTLSDEDRRRFHVILGKDAQGRTLVAYAPTALSDVMKWFGGNEFARLAGEYVRGQITFPQLAHEWISNTPGDVLNNALQGISPQIKAAMIATTRKQPFPDILNQRSIADYDLRWAVLGSTTDGLTADALRRLLDDNYYSGKSWGDWAQQNILQARRRDPEQWGFYATMDRVAAYQKAHGGTVDLGVNNKADAEMLGSFRRAIRAGDVPAALNFYQKLLDNGYTAERFRASIDHADPLATLKREVRKEFVAGLSPAEQEDLRNGYKYAARMQAFDHRERQLFPSEKATRDYRARYAAQGGRPDVFAGIMETFANQPEDQLELRAETLMRSSLRPVKR